MPFIPLTIVTVLPLTLKNYSENPTQSSCNVSVLAPSHFVCDREYGKEGTIGPQIQNGYCKNIAHLMMIRDQMNNYKKEKESELILILLRVIPKAI